MRLLKPAINDVGFLKAGILGLPKSGKTYTAAMIAAGIALKSKTKKPIAFYDTEGGSSYLVDRFKELKLDIVVCKSRSFSDLTSVMEEAVTECSALIIDSITHPWVEICDTYLSDLNAKRAQKRWTPLQRLEFQHWRELKQIWRQKFTEPYLNSHLHIIMCGRAGWEYEYQENSEGKKELIKGDVKMKAEAETGYEPSLLLWMERDFDESGHLRHRCVVLGDRFNVIQGREFLDPTWKDFQPFWDRLNLGADHQAVDTSRTSSDMLNMPDIETDERRFQRKIQLEEIEGHLLSAFPGKTAKESKLRADLTQVAFSTRSETAMSAMHPDQLLAGKLVLLHLIDCLNKAAEEQIEVPMGPDFVAWLEKQARSFAPPVEEDDLPDHRMEGAQ